MHSIRPLVLAAALAVIMTLALTGCAAPAPSPVSASTPEPVTLKIAVLPILDTLPMYVAQKEGFFEAHGIRVEFVPVKNAIERDQLIAAGQADGMINEPLSTMFFNQEEIQVQIVRYARAATKDGSLFSILVAKNSGISSVQEIKGVEIGVSQGTVIDYLTDRLLEAEGLQHGEIKNIAIPDLTVRMSLLGTGELKAATLPEPLASLAAQQGATVLLSDTSHPEYSYSTITFRKAVIDQNPGAIRAFLAAIEDATARINSDPSQYSTLLVEQKLVPAPLEGTFQVPQVVTASVPDKQQWEDALEWAKSEGLLSHDVSYEDSVSAEYLPE
ncbi:MAG: hypothetical protein EHM70_22330 [Chloroflexota bacterium]|nr:MAG: hypothetical protein EHM70_22330 [Chloroflexota bacterium]